MRQGPHQKRGRGRGNRRPSTPNRNQTFDSNGPDVRIRGNASQVYEKYLNLARDAMASGDRVLAESYYQHAEHYYRILSVFQESQGGENRGPGGQPHSGGGSRDWDQDDEDGGDERGDGDRDRNERGDQQDRDRGDRPRADQDRGGDGRDRGRERNDRERNDRERGDRERNFDRERGNDRERNIDRERNFDRERSPDRNERGDRRPYRAEGESESGSDSAQPITARHETPRLDTRRHEPPIVPVATPATATPAAPAPLVAEPSGLAEPQPAMVEEDGIRRTLRLAPTRSPRQSAPTASPAVPEQPAPPPDAEPERKPRRRRAAPKASDDSAGATVVDDGGSVAAS